MIPPEPTVTLGMPVYNGEAFIASAIESLLAQTYTDFELIISDNASTDNTQSICRDFSVRDARIRYHRQLENLGSVTNFNCLVALARGKYFKWAASDDICRPTYLHAVVEVLESEPRVLWCHSQSGKIDQHGRILTNDDLAAEGLAHTSQAGLPRHDHASQRRHRRFRGVLLGTSWCADAYGLIRTLELSKSNLFPSCYGSEKVLLAELALRGCYREVPETLFYQRVHSTASGSLKSHEQQAQFALARPKRILALTRFELLLGHLRAVNNVAMPITDRLLCYGVICQYLFQSRKWRKIVSDDLHGRPLGKYMTEDRVAPSHSNNSTPRLERGLGN